jgi:alkylation response protein AidB-like acyl-CoA dehydrogenase
MDFKPSPEVAELRERVLDFMDEQIYPQEREIMEALDAEVATGVPYPQNLAAVRERAKEAGLWNLFMPDERFGPGLKNWEYGLLCEEMGRSPMAAPMAFNCSAPDTGNMEILAEHGTSEQRERWLEPLLEGKIRSCFSMTEPEVSGSDPTLLQARAELDGDEWVINGAKHYTTNGSGWDRELPDVITLVCRTDPDKPPQESLAVIVVEKGTPGVEITGIIDTIGHRATISPRLEFTNVRVPAGNILGRPGDGMEIVKTAFSWTCAPIGAACVGRMRAAFDYAYEFAKTDNRSGPHPVIEYQNAGYMLADLKIRIEAARYLTWKAADHFDKTGGKDRELANIVKVFASETSVQVVYDAMRLVGVDAYTDLTPIAGIMQDVLCFPVYDGGNMGVRRRQLHEMFQNPTYDPLGPAENRLSTT